MVIPDRLTVWMDSRAVATLSRTRELLQLAYTEETLASVAPNTPLLSVSMPVGPVTFIHHVVRPFFDGLLPEGQARRMLAHDFRLSEDDTFGLLAVLGRDCAGALSLLPEGEPWPDVAAIQPIPLTAEDVATRLAQLSIEPLGVDGRVRVSLAGVQQKMVLTRLPDATWAHPINGLPSTHIFKRADERWPGMVEVEALCLAIGAHLGVRTAHATVALMSEPVLIVERYDRRIDADGSVQRIHQEDATQALSIPSTRKYQEHGGPSLRVIAGLLRDWTPGSASLDRLVDLTFLNIAVGNADAHAKNLSLLRTEGGGITLAPGYDIVCTTWYDKADQTLAMFVHDKRSIEDVTARDLIAEAMSWGMSERRVGARVAALVDRLPGAIAAAYADVPTAPAVVVALLQRRAEAWARNLRGTSGRATR